MTYREHADRIAELTDELKAAIWKLIRRDFVRLRNLWLRFSDLFRRDLWRDHQKRGGRK